MTSVSKGGFNTFSGETRQETTTGCLTVFRAIRNMDLLALRLLYVVIVNDLSVATIWIDIKTKDPSSRPPSAELTSVASANAERSGKVGAPQCAAWTTVSLDA